MIAHLFKSAYGEYQHEHGDLRWCQRCEQWIGRVLQGLPCPGPPVKTCHHGILEMEKAA